jgi:hypothetical protein
MEGNEGQRDKIITPRLAGLQGPGILSLSAPLLCRISTHAASPAPAHKAIVDVFSFFSSSSSVDSMTACAFGCTISLRSRRMRVVRWWAAGNGCYCPLLLSMVTEADQGGEESSPVEFPSAAAAAGSVGWLGIHQQACESLLMNQLFSSLTQALLPVPAIAILTATVSSASFFFPLHIPGASSPLPFQIGDSPHPPSFPIPSIIGTFCPSEECLATEYRRLPPCFFVVFFFFFS